MRVNSANPVVDSEQAPLLKLIHWITPNILLQLLLRTVSESMPT